MSEDGSAAGATRNASRGNDSWFEWLLSVRHGGDAAYAAALQPLLDDIRDRVLDHAGLRPNQHIGDIGCGDGLMGFAGLDRHAGNAVTFVDISAELIAHVRAAAQRRDCAARCRFVVASAEALGAIPTASLDVVLVRAVLAYVADKAAAVGEFRRILRPGGRLSLVDPIFQDRAFGVAGLATQRRPGATDVAARYAELAHRCGSAHFPDSLDAIARDPLTNYNERDLLRIIESAGFTNVHLRLHIDSIAALPMPWHVFLAGAPRAGVPTIEQVLAARFTANERREFEQFFRPGVEAGSTVERNVNAYIFADAP